MNGQGPCVECGILRSKNTFLQQRHGNILSTVFVAVVIFSFGMFVVCFDFGFILNTKWQQFRKSMQSYAEVRGSWRA